MQVHNHDASQVIFAFNRWGGAFSGGSEVGIGTNSAGEPDYTFSENGGNHTTRNLYVLVREWAPTFPPPEVTAANGSIAGDKILLTFSEEISSASVDVANFFNSRRTRYYGCRSFRNQCHLDFFRTGGRHGLHCNLHWRFWNITRRR
ncbi:MAG: hypothetical protein ACKVLL_04120 [Verrucomicrobiales bacterium]|jgi:hypothetical protein